MRSIAVGLILTLSIASAACSAPPVPVEIDLLKAQEEKIWRAGGESLYPVDYSSYVSAAKLARLGFLMEQGKFSLLRDYDQVKADYQKVMADGDGLLARINAEKQMQQSRLDARMAEVTSTLDRFNDLTTRINQKDLRRRLVAKAEFYLDDARRLADRGKTEQALAQLDTAASYLREAKKGAEQALLRYMDSRQLEQWKQMADRTIKESARTKSLAIIVDKLDRRLTIYRGGHQIKSYQVGIGHNGLADKLRSGDRATPEGEYRIVKKVYPSRFHKALLFNYPNEEDIRRFRIAKARGQIPKGASIGSLLEIHGGGPDSMTNGCVSLDNGHMDDLFDLIQVGTPVTIVGTLSPDRVLLAWNRKS